MTLAYQLFIQVGWLSVNILINTVSRSIGQHVGLLSVDYRSTYQLTNVGWDVNWELADMANKSQPICWSSIGPKVSTNTQLRGAQITKDPMIALFQDLVAILKSCSSTEREIFDMVIRYLQLICTSNNYSMIKPMMCTWDHIWMLFCT